jgi:hypothetical protein
MTPLLSTTHHLCFPNCSTSQPSQVPRSSLLFPDARPGGLPTIARYPTTNKLARTTTCLSAEAPRMFPCACRRRVMQRAARSAARSAAASSSKQRQLLPARMRSPERADSLLAVTVTPPRADLCYLWPRDWPRIIDRSARFDRDALHAEIVD